MTDGMSTLRMTYIALPSTRPRFCVPSASGRYFKIFVASSCPDTPVRRRILRRMMHDERALYTVVVNALQCTLTNSDAPILLANSAGQQVLHRHPCCAYNMHPCRFPVKSGTDGSQSAALRPFPVGRGEPSRIVTNRTRVTAAVARVNHDFWPLHSRRRRRGWRRLCRQCYRYHPFIRRNRDIVSRYGCNIKYNSRAPSYSPVRICCVFPPAV